MVCTRGRGGAHACPDGAMSLLRKTRCISALAVVVVFSAAAAACSVPTFRYALERWPADAYEVLLFHRGKLSKAEQASVKLLEDASLAEEGEFTNVAVLTVDLADKEVDKRLLSLLPAAAQEKLPWMLVRYPPYHRIAESLVSAPLSAAAVKTVLNSPKRDEIAKRLVAGQTAVWVLLEGGNRKADEAAATLLAAELKKLQTALKLPELLPPGLQLPSNVQVPKLRVAFSLMRLARNDPAEKMLVEILLRAEPDLTDAEYAGKPMALPIFGRARAMYALVGAGINADNIADACAKLVYPCSCRIKQALTGTGIDLLSTADWEAAIGGIMLTDFALPLTGLANTAPATAPTAPASAPASLAATQAAPTPVPAISTVRHSSGILWHVLVTLGVIGIVVAGLAIALKYRSTQR